MKKDKKQADKKNVWGWLTPLRSKNGASEGQGEHECCGGGGCCGDGDEECCQKHEQKS